MLLLPSDKNPALNENHSSSGMVKSDVDVGKHPLSYDDDDDIYHYPRKLRWAKNRLAKMHDGQKSIQFLDKLKLIGLSDARICYYSDRLPLILSEFKKLDIKLKNATKSHCESILSNLISQKNYKSETKSAMEISAETKTPISTVYRRIPTLHDNKLLHVSGNITEDGKKLFLYKSKIKGIQSTFSNGQVEVKLILNN